MAEQASGRPADGSRSTDPPGGDELSRWVWVLPAVVILLVAGVVAALVLAEGREGDLEPDEARLLRNGTPGPDPFAIVEVEPVPPSGLPLPAAPTGPVVAGDTPGLYAGVRGSARCRADEVAAALEDEAREAWADVQSVDIRDLDGMLDDLIPVILRRDTLVTSHRLDGAVAVPEAAVLQSGTAVLVDARGLPKVRCDGTQPLGGGRRPASWYSFRGTTWLGFSAGQVVRVTASERPTEGLRLVDPTTGGTFVRGRGGVVDADG